jgi:hypothetical protein
MLILVVAKIDDGNGNKKIEYAKDQWMYGKKDYKCS